MLQRRTTRRLPGFRFETQAPPLAEWLPRMDVTCFVGFAASGPLDTPVAVESLAHFNALFGADAPLAWDAARGEPARAYLAPAVRAFFTNGGRRCWIVRVAKRFSATNKTNRARYNYFPLTGLAMAALDAQGRVTKLNPAFARARSEGSWSDTLETSAALLSRSLEVIAAAFDKLSVDLAVDAPDDIGVGDLLRFTFAEGWALLLYVGTVTPLSASTPGTRGRVRVAGAQGVWLRTRAGADQAGEPTKVKVQLFNFEPRLRPFVKTNYDEEQTVFDRFLLRYDATLQPIINDAVTLAGQLLTLDIEVAPLDAPAPGSLVAVELADGQLWVTVQQTSITTRGVNSTGVRVTGPGVWRSGRTPNILPTTIRAAERLSFELWVRRADEYALSVSDLGFHPRHARFWAQLPTDRAIYQRDESAPVEAPARALWQPVGDALRFPLAGSPTGDALYLPLAVPPVPEQFLPPVRLPGSGLERDGLAEFDAGLFLDPDLCDATAEDLLARAEFKRYLSTNPRRLTGLHAALEIEEVTIIAVPDAVQRGWTQSEAQKAPPPAPSEPLPRPAWWRFDCAQREQPPLVAAPQTENFLACGLRVVAPPQLQTSTELTQTGTYTLSWTAAEPEAQFILEETTALDEQDRMTGAAVIYTGPGTRFTLYGRRDGAYYYRVRVVAADDNASDWSNGVAVRVAAAGAWQLQAEDDYDAGLLRALQRALLRMAAARGDLLAVLTLPAHYREDKALEHLARLKRIAGHSAREVAANDESANDENANTVVPPFNGGEAHVFSYGALYHPWLVGGVDMGEAGGAFRRVPPDGAACGVLAARALTRGAWIAPANEALRGVVAVTPGVERARWLDLQNAQINLVRQEPRGFLTLNADTLSDDEAVRLINVRRLLILLRRLALRHGATYVFEPNSDAFRRGVERGFEGLLDRLFVRGAFAGATAATSYQVNTGDTLNTRQSVEEGRFIVELRVAPSEPLTFLTLRLVQTGERGVVTEVR